MRHRLRRRERKELSLVQRQDVLDRLQFQDHVVIDYDVGPVPTVEKVPFIVERQRDLPRVG